MRKLSLILVLPMILTSACAGPGRAVLDAGGAAGGAYLGHTLGKGNPAATVAGAAGGVLLSEGAQGLIRSSQKKSYKQGYLQGQSDAIKQRYWRQREMQRFPK